MYKGIDGSMLVVCFLTSAYCDKVNGDNAGDNCLKEWRYAIRHKTVNKMIAVPMEDDMHNFPGEVSVLSSIIYTSTFGLKAVATDAAFEQQLDNLAARIRFLKGPGVAGVPVPLAGPVPAPVAAAVPSTVAAAVPSTVTAPAPAPVSAPVHAQGLLSYLPGASSNTGTSDSPSIHPTLRDAHTLSQVL